MTKKATANPKTSNGGPGAAVPKGGRRSPLAGWGGARTPGPLQELQELYKFMQANSLESLELDKKDFHVRLVRQGRATVTVPVPFPVAAAGMPIAAPAAGPATAAPAAAPSAAPLAANQLVVKSPMMGIFYRAASPSSPPFVKDGDTVKAGETLCLIEAMKVFNDVKAEVTGVVVRALLENGKPVKVGQDIFILERK